MARRIVVSLIVALAAASIHYAQQLATPGHPGDFGVAWFGARALLDGRNPFELIGPGLEYDWPWAPLYPATAMVVAIPFSFLPQLSGTMLFVAVSAGLFTFAITIDGWKRLPVLVSYPFIISAAAAQWSPLLSAAFVLPPVAAILIAKPTIGGSIAAASDWKVQRWAIYGGIAILAVSFLLMPDWVSAWWRAVSNDLPEIPPPLFRGGGFVIGLTLLRWRRPEARLIFALSLVPQTSSWYELVPLLLVASTLNESMILAIVTSLGWLAQDYLMSATNAYEFSYQVGVLMVVFGYIPATIMVLRRPNVGETPKWMTLLRRPGLTRDSDSS